MDGLMATNISHRGDRSSADQPMYITLYPNSSNEDSVCENEIGNGLTTALDQLYEANATDYYQLDIRFDHPQKTDTAGVGYFHTKFREFWEEQYYNTEIGHHIAVSHEISGGESRSGNGGDQSAFVKSLTAVAGTEKLDSEDRADKSFYKNVAIHEALHGFIDYENSDVDDMTKDGGKEHEHDLGHVWGDHSSSPMITAYEGIHTSHGTCDDAPGHWGFYSTDLTNCTKDAVGSTGYSDR